MTELYFSGERFTPTSGFSDGDPVDPGGGGGGGGGGTKVLELSFDPDVRSFVEYNLSVAEPEFWVQFRVMFPADSYTEIFTWQPDIIAFASSTGIRSSIFADDSTDKLWDWWSSYPAWGDIPADTWVTIDAHMAIVDSTSPPVKTLQFGFRVNSGALVAPEETSEESFNDTFSGSTTWDFIRMGNAGFPSVPLHWYMDDLKVSYDNWVCDGGAIAFSDDYESGSVSGGSVGGAAAVVPTP